MHYSTNCRYDPTKEFEPPIKGSSGIYLIISKATNRFYVGQSVDIRKRWSYHKSSLKAGTHANKHLQNIYNKYGITDLDFRIWGFYPEDQLNQMEYSTIYEVSRRDIQCVNIKGAQATSRFKRQLSDKEKENLRVKFLGDKNPFFGKTHTEETKKKLSELKLGSGTKYFLIDPSGQLFKGINVRNFSIKHSLNRKYLGELISGKRKQYRGWKVCHEEE